MRPRFPHKPAAPSVKTTIGAAIARSKGVQGDEPASDSEVLADILLKLDLPASIRTEWQARYKADLRTRKSLEAQDEVGNADDQSEP